VDDLVDRLDAYCDAVPRRAARAEPYGSLVLFVREREGWPFYARPARGGSAPAAGDVVRTRSRQRELGIPEAFEWIADVSPGMRDAAVAGGLVPNDHPLMVHRGGPTAAADGLDVRLVDADEELSAIAVVAGVAFANPGTGAGEAGAVEVARLAAVRKPKANEELRARMLAGELVLAAGFLDGAPVATGIHQPVDGVTEIAGVGTLPSARRRGFGAAVTGLLVEDARSRGVETVFLSAGDDEIARLYGSLGFERVGTACIAAPAWPPTER
jgi:ribosomal protein S18 acetylase RimI-like enzyme